LGAIQSSKSKHIWITMNFGKLFFLHTLSISTKFFGKVAYTILVCMVKISYQSKKLQVFGKYFSRRRFNYRYMFCNFFTFQSQFVDTMSHSICFLSPICWLVGFKALYSLKIFHLVGSEIEFHLKMYCYENFSILFQH